MCSFRSPVVLLFSVVLAYSVSLSITVQAPAIDLSGYQQIRYVNVAAPTNTLGEGSLEHPWRKLDYALSKITDSTDTNRYAILIASGTYTAKLSAYLFILKPWVDLYGGYDPATWERDLSQHKTVLLGTSENPVVNMANHTCLDGLTVTGGTKGGIVWEFVSPVTIAHCTVTNNTSPNKGAGISFYMSDVTLTDCVISDNYTERPGGGLFSGSSTLVMEDCVIENNRSDGYAGGLSSQDSTIQMTGCEYTGNYGGGVSANGSDLSIDHSTFIQNSSALSGGGVACSYSDRLVLADCIISENTSSSSGGGFSSSGTPISILRCQITLNQSKHGGGGSFGCDIEDETTEPSLISNCLFSGNSATQYGGGIRFFHALNLDVESCTFTQNTSPMGGGLYYDWDSKYHINDCLIADNIGSSTGGGIACNRRNEVTYQGCTISGNTTQGKGGGIYTNYDHPRFLNCTLLDNSAGLGGGAFCHKTDAQFANCIIGRNEATTEGGGLIFSRTDTHTAKNPLVVNCSILTNHSGQGAGGIQVEDGSNPSFINTILWDDTANEIVIDASSTADFQYCNIQGGWPGTLNINLPPQVKDIENGDFHLLAGSPCIGAGIGPSVNPLVPSTDFEGDLRAGSICDIGADEAATPSTILDWANYQ